MEVDNVAIGNTPTEKYSFDSTTATFTFKYTNIADAGAHTIKVKCTDGIDSRIVSTTYVVTSVANAPPSLKSGKSLTLDSFIVARTISTGINKNLYFEDTDGDTFTMDCSDSYEWLAVTKIDENYVISGSSPADNTAWASKSLTIPCTLKDSLNNEKVYTFLIPLTANQ